MTNGTVKFFNAAKGFGFITPDGGGKDVFLPSASIGSSGIPALKPGQRLSFEETPDSKGPKAINLKLLAEAPKVVSERPSPPVPETGRMMLTIYHDPDSDESNAALTALRAAGHEPRIVDYIETPPTRDELRNLSLLLRESDQSLARKYDPLFHELRLDDRFISENDFWTAIVEHPSLINGPVLTTGNKARICRSENAVRSFLGLDPLKESRAAEKPKGISPRIAALATGGEMPPPRPKEPAVKTVEKKVAQAPEPKAKDKAAPARKAVKPAKETTAKPAKKAKSAPAKKAVRKK
jgi:arsenate reductase (glutaredoxin)